LLFKTRVTLLPVLLDAHAPYVIMAETPLRVDTALLGSLTIPCDCFGLVLLDTATIRVTIAVTIADEKLRHGIALLGRLEVPGERLSLVLLDTATIAVTIAETDILAEAAWERIKESGRQRLVEQGGRVGRTEQLYRR
jgi:hypothetical protein